MCFNLRTLGAVLTAVLFFSLSGCGLNIGEPAPDPKPVTLSPKELACLGEIGEKVSDYFAAKSTEKQVEEFSGCVKGALQKFALLTRGKDSDSYRPEEIVEFLHENFLKNSRYHISSEFLSEVMKLKKTFFGGSADKITRAEFAKIIDHVDFVKKQLIRMRPYMDVINVAVGEEKLTQRGWQPDLDGAEQALFATAQDYGTFFTEANEPLPIDSIESYFTEFRRFLKWDEEDASSHTPKDWSELIRAFKSISVSPPANLVAANEWQPLIRAGARWYMTFLRYKYLVRWEQISTEEGLRALEQAARGLFDALDEAIEHQPSGVIDFDQLDALVDALGQVGFLPHGFEPNAVKQVMRPVVAKVFSDLSSRNSQVAGVMLVAGLDDMARVQMEQEFFQWLYAQRYINKNWKKMAENSYLKRSEQSGSSYKSQSLPVSPGGDFVGEIMGLAERMRPLFKQGDPRVFLLGDNEISQYKMAYGHYSYTKLNVMRVFARLLIRGWSKDSFRATNMLGVTEDEMQKFYLDVKPFGVAMKFMDPRNEFTGKRSFMEGNHFTFSGNGFQGELGEAAKETPLLTLNETIELITLVYSGGQVHKAVYRDLLKVCPLGPYDVFGEQRDGEMVDPGIDKGRAESSPENRMISSACFERRLMQMFIEHFDNMPNMVNYLAGLDQDRWVTFVEKLRSVAKPSQERPVGGRNDWIERGQIATMATVLHYVEALYVRYDKNSNGLLDSDELWEAYPRFKGLIARTAVEQKKKKLDEQKKIGEISEAFYRRELANAVLSDADLEKAFAYILAKRKVPRSCMELADTGVLYWWRRDEIALDRTGILEVIHGIAKLSEESGDTCPIGDWVSTVKRWGEAVGDWWKSDPEGSGPPAPDDDGWKVSP
ncbi:MAG: hypothetical protein H6626_02660 [Pseudobdellovibrionaceae bacterium]|nr:hypothetical protein [Bdellovibrionales bacterium]USN48008.1 MAG: hypothetical protein H6626_02660 [Pseudobdellovibrionaceae bacterium]